MTYIFYFSLLVSTLIAYIGSAGQLAIAQTNLGLIRRLAQTMDLKPSGLGMPCSNRTAWQKLRPRFAVQIEEAEGYLSKPIPVFEENKYTEFSKTGIRVNGEKMLLDRQNELGPLVLAECVEGNGRFIPKITELVDSIAAQKSWVYPASDPKLDDFSQRSVVIDLNAATVADLLAQTVYLLSSSLSPAVQQHVASALETRIFVPMRAAYTKGGGPSWLTMKSNWNAVCLSGVTGAALSVLPDPMDRALFVAGAQHYSAYYLEGFPSDGYSTEGIGYWNYGAGDYLELAARLFQATHGFVNIMTDPATRRIALYGLEIQMLPGLAADFGDAPFMSHPNPQLLNYLEYVLSLSDANGAPAADPRSLPAVGLLSLDALTSFPIQFDKAGTSPSGGSIGLHTYFPVSKVLVSRASPGSRFAMTFKAGGTSGHSHNDLGSFSIGYKGQQPLGDPGGPLYYSAQSFSSQRRESPLVSSYGHLIPMIGGKLQEDADTLNIPVLKTTFTPTADSITVDLTSAYHYSPLKSYIRTVTYNRNGSGSLDVIDNFTLTAPTNINEGLPTHGTWQQAADGTIQIDLKGSRLLIKLEAPTTPLIKADAVNESGNLFTRIGATVHLQTSGTIKLHITPVP